MNAFNYEVIVIGGGHAGVEAAAASARVGCKTLLLTHNLDTIGQMSCNPAIGGIGKTHLVKEVDALDGIMASATDRAAIHLKTLNLRKGPAVQATRAQTDRNLYRQAVQAHLYGYPNLSLLQQPVQDLIVQEDRIAGVITQSGHHFYSAAVILTAGTFLQGTIHIGDRQASGGRAGDQASVSLAHR